MNKKISDLSKIVSEAINKVISDKEKEKDEENIRNMIGHAVNSFSIDANKGIIKVSFGDEKTANSVIDSWIKHWPILNGYEIISVEPFPIGDDFSSIFAKRNGGTCMYKIKFRKNEAKMRHIRQ